MLQEGICIYSLKPTRIEKAHGHFGATVYSRFQLIPDLSMPVGEP